MRLQAFRSPLALDQALDRIAGAWRWWLGELAPLVPRALRARLTPAQPLLVLDVSDDEAVLSYPSNGGHHRLERVGAGGFDRSPSAPLAKALAELGQKR